MPTPEQKCGDCYFFKRDNFDWDSKKNDFLDNSGSCDNPFLQLNSIKAEWSPTKSLQKNDRQDIVEKLREQEQTCFVPKKSPVVIAGGGSSNAGSLMAYRRGH